MQFRAIDYGMETCELKMRFSVEHASTPFGISVHNLSTTQYLDTKSISYRTRPPRMATLGSIAIEKPLNIDWSRNFTCHWDELMTFEVSCAEGNASLNPDTTQGCSLSWWQDEVDDNPSQGLSHV